MKNTIKTRELTPQEIKNREKDFSDELRADAANELTPKKFCVNVCEKSHGFVEVEAVDAEEAEKLAHDAVANGMGEWGYNETEIGEITENK